MSDDGESSKDKALRKNAEYARSLAQDYAGRSSAAQSQYESAYNAAQQALSGAEATRLSDMGSTGAEYADKTAAWAKNYASDLAGSEARDAAGTARNAARASGVSKAKAALMGANAGASQYGDAYRSGIASGTSLYQNSAQSQYDNQLNAAGKKAELAAQQGTQATNWASAATAAL